MDGNGRLQNMKKENGYLSVEASISLTVFLFMMMFMLNFGQIYLVQNYINHNLYQASKMVSYYGFDYEERVLLEDVCTLIKSLSGASVGIEGEWWKQAILGREESDYSKCVKLAFDNMDENVQTTLAAYGVEEVNIDQATGKEHDMSVTASYVIKLRFQFAGIKEITMHQHVKCGLWAKGE